MKTTNKAKDISPVMEEDFHHTIILSHLKSTASISGTFLPVHGLPMPLNRWTNPRHYLKRFNPRITTGNSTTWQYYISTIPLNS